MIKFTLISLLIFVSITNVKAQNPGVLDASFTVGTGANGSILATAIQSDGKILIGGDFTSYNGTSINRIARLNTDGTLDPTFNVGTGANAAVRAIAIQSDGNILIGGSFLLINGSPREYLAKLDTDGSCYPDWAFQPTNFNGTVNTIAIQNDGKILVGGGFTLFQGVDLRGLARMDNFGLRDQTFSGYIGANNGASGSVNCIGVQTDGKIIIGGLFGFVNGTTRNRIARLNSDGTLDSFFNNGAGFAASSLINGVYSLKIQSDGKILVGGDFTSFNGVAMDKYGRLNSNGTRDTGFSNYSISGSVASFNIQSDGKIIVSGQFTNFAGSGINNIGRVSSIGIIDATFTAGTGAGNSIFTSALQNDGKIIIGGFFTSYNGTGVNKIARIMGDCTPPSAPTGSSNQSFCNAGMVSDLSATGNNIQWYSSVSGGTHLSPSTPLVNGASYYASQTVTCVSLSRFQVTVSINQPSDPTFDQIPNICQGDLFILPSVSNNGINGVWSPSIDNTVTTTYSFIPNVNECANSASMTVLVTQSTTPTFTQVSPICSGETLSALPTTSNNSIDGSWSPALNNMTSTTYTFTPSSNASPTCATTTNMTITVNPLPNVTLSAFNSLCDTAGIVTLTGGSPVGGTYSGTSVTNNSFNTVNGVGTYPITYSYTDNNGCSKNATKNLSVILCSGADITELEELGISLYPNPTSKSITIESTENNIGKLFEIHDVSGRVILSGKLEANKTNITVSDFATGTYYLKVPELNKVVKFVKQ
jgi:uncharacterized delta-60 repeat protein